MRHTTLEYDGIGLHVVSRHCLEPVVQIGLEPSDGSIVDSKSLLKVDEKDGVVDCIKGSRKS